MQRASELVRAIKQAADNDRRPGRFLLTGSANILALPPISDSLAGADGRRYLVAPGSVRNSTQPVELPRTRFCRNGHSPSQKDLDEVTHGLVPVFVKPVDFAPYSGFRGTGGKAKCFAPGIRVELALSTSERKFHGVPFPLQPRLRPLCRLYPGMRRRGSGIQRGSDPEASPQGPRPARGAHGIPGTLCLRLCDR